MKFVEIDKAELNNCTEEVFDIELEKNHFFASNGIITHNCRMSSDMDMLEMASSVNSFGGVGISLGSHRVVTLSLVRQAILATSYEDFLDRVFHNIQDAGAILKAHKTLLAREEEAGLQPYITDGTISLSRLFSTFGLIGVWECFKIIQDKFGKIEDIDIKVIKQINTWCIERGQELGLYPNLEQVPGETLAVKMAKADRLLFGKELQPFYIYSNQFVPLTEKADLFERMDADGRVNKLITGGGIVHITTGDQVTPAQAMYIIEYAVKSGCEHLALNLVTSIGECGHITNGKVNKCPKCGAKIKDYSLRVVGFVTLVSNWIPERRKEFEERFLVSLPKV